MIQKFKFWVQKVLPLVYDDSLSYYEVLCKVVDKLNECIALVNKLQEAVDYLTGLVEGFDERITANTNAIAQLRVDLTALQGTVDKYHAELLDMLADVNSKIAALDKQQAINTGDIADLKAITDDLQTQIDKWNDLTGDATKALKAYIDQRVAELKLYHDEDIARLDEIIKEILEELAKRPINDVYNYPLCNRVDFDTNNWQLYNDMSNAPKAEDYCKLGLSADDYKDYDLTAMMYMRDGFDQLHCGFVYMPISGKRQEVSNAMTEGVNYVLGTVDADGYVQLDLTADDYAALGLDNNAYRRYYKADGDTTPALHDFLVSNGEGITSGMYKTLQTQH